MPPANIGRAPVLSSVCCFRMSGIDVQTGMLGAKRNPVVLLLPADSSTRELTVELRLRHSEHEQTDHARAR
jgi:hypothetical protein